MTVKSRDTEIVAAYAAAFTSLTPERMDRLLDLVAPDVRFVDPFNELRGKPAFKAVFDHMYETTVDPKFTISDIAHAESNGHSVAYLRWRMTARTKGWPSMDLEFEGMTEVHINPDGLISAHIDHWDSASQLLARLPFLGALVRALLRLFKVRKPNQ